MNKVIILLGPTGVGKTGVSILLAKTLGTDVISADSMQIYRHMDIGTAKLTPEERAIVKHHMIDIVEPWESFSTGEYIRKVLPIIDSLHHEGKIPVVVGGTGLYIKAITRGIFSGPSADWFLRDELLALEKMEKGALYSCLQEVDSEAAGRITPGDLRRIIRALEVSLKSGKPISEIQKKMTQPIPYKFIKIGLSRERRELYRIIETRIDKMIKAGLVEEVAKVMNHIEQKSDQRCNPGPLPSMQAIGYKEMAMYLQGRTDLETSIRLIKRATKRYAKRQFTWFRKERDIHWIDITGVCDIHSILKPILDVIYDKLKRGAAES
ncbi:MAG: tRNA (adenosine(37)-N6)-dimethylallyltransferase MiaA [Nitrospirota bacterium]